ncbi:hypothetical protein JCM5350_000444 [Sporobolomyces pararoseus]
MTQLTSEEDARVRPYVLSAILKGHTNDVRSLSTSNNSSSSSSSSSRTTTVYSGSRDGTARSWYTQSSDNSNNEEWIEGKVWKGGHEGFINSVCYFERESDSKGFLLTGGIDSLIQVYSTSSTSQSEEEPIQTLLGHRHNVCSLHVDKKGKKVASASWDMTVRIWETSQDWESKLVLKEHGAAVWDVLLLENEDERESSTFCLTACADNYVRLFKDDKVERIFKGHTGPVRALSKIDDSSENSPLFASASNDGTIRIWNYKTGQPLTVLNHNDFIYSITFIPPSSVVDAEGGGLASSGEDGLIKIWNGKTGELDQVLELPCLSVWNVVTLDNGDLVCAGSDSLIWVFTRDEKRIANREALKEYEEKLLEKNKKKESIRKGNSPQEEKAEVAVHSSSDSILDQPGQSQGEIKLVREQDNVVVIAYQWNGSLWESLGQVVDDPPSSATTTKKMIHEGKEYDFVFQIDVSDDKPPIPLPFNLRDDVLEVSKEFVRENELPDSYVDRIVEFIRFNAYS